MELAARTAAWSGKALPYDAEVEYLYSDGRQYIDTEYDPNMLRTKVFYDFLIPSIPSANCGFFGCRVVRSASNDSSFNAFVMQTGIVRFDIIGVWPTGQVSGVIGDRHSIESLANIMTVSGIGTYEASVTRPDKRVGASFIVGNFMEANTGRLYSSIGAQHYIYGVKLHEDSVAIRDLIPVRKDGVGYLYDKVSGELFGNAGTGSFVIGPDKVSAGGGGM